MHTDKPTPLLAFPYNKHKCICFGYKNTIPFVLEFLLPFVLTDIQTTFYFPLMLLLFLVTFSMFPSHLLHSQASGRIQHRKTGF